ncbi:hypothetical protein O181_074935 [Austropuccinia psidii MF-1]|uniref:Reverse transcriptase Ty1/copia-type domain-containing protein n=1 Tax=Austropuccinia psidii MF-1 TaxID=1389203 RepID=A0A9Q3FDE6_9BASI|nr:hypothetical protein [Austropuccinia psidii MF-1]
MKNLNVWREIPIKKEYKLVGTTWVFKTKRDKNRQTLEHKARLCAQGFSQVQGGDYSKTFAPTGKLNSLRTLISLAASKNLSFEQLDIKSTFLNAPLTKDAFLSIPQVLDRDKKNLCLKLNKAIYGLKQAALAWYTRLSKWLIKFGFKMSKANSCLFYLNTEEPIWLFLHVDDIGVFGKNLSKFKRAIMEEFHTKMLGIADLMLGIKITHNDNAITLSKNHYIDSLLELYGMSNCKPVSTPLVPNLHLEAATTSEKEEFLALKINYRSAIGSLSYLSSATRPDLSYSVSALSQFLENPGIHHWKAFLHVLRYLKGTNNIELNYQRNLEEPPVAYSDADWGNCCITRQSVTGYLVTLNGNLVIWKTGKQPTVSLSSAEAEYRSLTDLFSELLWFKQLCKDIDVMKIQKPITIHEDNQGCIDTANSNCNTNTRRMKHVEIQLHFIQQAIKNSTIALVYTPKNNMLADFLTKSVLENGPPNSKPITINNWNKLSLEAIQLILSRLHPDIIVTVLDAVTVKNTKALWKKINEKYEAQTITNRRRTWLRWECLLFNGNIKEYVKECQSILFDIAGIGISLPQDIMACSILGKVSRDSNAYDHVINSMVLTMNAMINPQQVLDKFSELLQHKNTKNTFQKTIKSEENQSSALLTN